MRRRGPVPRLALVGEILHILQQAALLRAGQVGVTGVVAGVRVLVEVRQRVAPGLPVLGHVVVVPTVGLAGRQAGVDQRKHRHPRFAVLSQGADRASAGRCPPHRE